MPKPSFRMPSGAYLYTGAAETQAGFLEGLKQPTKKVDTKPTQGCYEKEMVAERLVLSPRWKPQEYVWEWDASGLGARWGTSNAAAYKDYFAMGGKRPSPRTRHEQSVGPTRGHEAAFLVAGEDPETLSVRPHGRHVRRLVDVIHASEEEVPSEDAPAGSKRAARQTIRILESDIAAQRQQAAQARARASSTLRWIPHDPQNLHSHEGMPFRGA